MLIKLMAVIAVATSCMASYARAEDTVVRRLTDADMRAAITAPKGTPSAAQIALHDGYQVQLLQRTQSGRVEQHFDWNEYLIVQEGDATFNFGGALVNAEAIRPGEMMGDSIRGGASVPIHKGDVVAIPAGTPHQMVLIPGATIRYLDFKGRKN